MKKFLIIFFVLGLFFLYCSDNIKHNHFIIKGNLPDAKNNDTISLVYYKDYITYKDSVIKVPVINNKFELDIVKPYPTKANLILNKNKNIEVFLTNSDILSIKIDNKNKNNSVLFEQKEYKDNICLRDLIKLLKKQKLYGRNIVQLFMSASGDNIKKIFDRFELESNKIYTQYKKQLSPEFDLYIKNYIKYFKLRGLINYPPYHEYYTKEKVDATNYFNFLNRVNIDYNPKIFSSDYISFLNNYVDYFFSKDTTIKKGDYYTKIFDLTKQLLKGDALDIILTSKLQEAIRYSENQDDVIKMYNDYLTICKNNHYKEIISKLKKDYERLNPGNPAPEIQLKDINGNDFKLSDLRGNVVYIKFWASWCGPCKKEIPFDIELEKYFKGQKVKFLRVSLDENEIAWRKMVAEKRLEGINIRCNGFESKIAKSYLIYGVPTYFIIDKNGNIGMRNAPRPSNKTKAIKAIKKFI